MGGPATSNLPARLRQLRTEAALTQRELAERSGLSLEFISRIERGIASPSLDAFLRFCSILQCTPNDLLVGDPEHDEAEKLLRLLQHSSADTARRAIHAAEAVIAYERSERGDDDE